MKFQKKSLTAAKQFQALRHSLLASNGSGRLGIGRFQYEYHTQPTAMSRTYLIRLVYEQNKRPKVIVLEPDIVDIAGGRRLPHVYQQNPPELCLYLPGAGEWSSELLLSNTIVPWTLLWLYYFENWLATDNWEGGGVHPRGQSREKSRKRGKKGGFNSVGHCNSCSSEDTSMG